MACKVFLQTKNGLKMPIVGLGTWRAVDKDIETALETALEIGYRHIDTATLYGNEHVIGKVLRNWLDSGRIQRKDLFVTTKLPYDGMRPSGVEAFLKESLKKLQLDYVDLYLIHTPLGIPEGVKFDRVAMARPDFEFDQTTDHVAIWKAMEAAVEKGWTRHIGVSNFNQRQIQRILDNCTIRPANLQVELHIYLQQPELVKFCQTNDISVTSYATLGSKGASDILGIKNPVDPLTDGVVLKIAKRAGKAPGQVLLRYFVQSNIIVIPKSTNPDRLRQNIELFDFELPADDMKALKELDRNHRMFDYVFFYPNAKSHPEYPYSRRILHSPHRFFQQI